MFRRVLMALGVMVVVGVVAVQAHENRVGGLHRHRRLSGRARF
jgi:hypothetical protein